MARDASDIGELAAKIFDRLEKQFDGKATICDALLLVELSDDRDVVEAEDGSMIPATIVLLQSTSDRTTVQAGILDFARRTLFEWADGDDDEEDEGETE